MELQKLQSLVKKVAVVGLKSGSNYELASYKPLKLLTFVQIVNRYSFLDYLFGGCKITLAVRFTVLDYPVCNIGRLSGLVYFSSLRIF